MSPHPPLVTWMIPVLNGMPYLPTTLESIENQTFKNFQVVLWDNGSTDGTLEEARNWIPSRLPGMVISDQPLPLGLARAAMIEKFPTGFCALIDADDINEPSRLQMQIEFLTAHPGVAVVGTQLRRIDASGKDCGSFSRYPLAHEQIVQEMLISNPIGQPSVLMRREPIVAVGNYRDFSPTHVEDYDLWLRLAAHGYRLANLPDELLRYRVHDKSTTQKSNAADRLDSEMLRRLVEAAPLLYGCSSETILTLRSRAMPFAAPALRKIARKLGDEAAVWHSRVFSNAARQMIAKTDFKSRTFVAAKSGGLLGVLSEVAAVLMDAARFGKRVIFGK